MSDNIKVKILMLKGAKGDTGNTMGSLLRLVGTTTVTTAGTRRIRIPISAYNPNDYVLQVYMNGLYLAEQLDYTIESETDTHYINLDSSMTINIPSDGGDVFRFVAFRIVAG